MKSSGPGCTSGSALGSPAPVACSKHAHHGAPHAQCAADTCRTSFILVSSGVAGAMMSHVQVVVMNQRPLSSRQSESLLCKSNRRCQSHIEGKCWQTGLRSGTYMSVTSVTWQKHETVTKTSSVNHAHTPWPVGPNRGECWTYTE